jgi:hypothetical protein
MRGRYPTPFKIIRFIVLIESCAVYVTAYTNTFTCAEAEKRWYRNKCDYLQHQESYERAWSKLRQSLLILSHILTKCEHDYQGQMEYTFYNSADSY